MSCQFNRSVLLVLLRNLEAYLFWGLASWALFLCYRKGVERCFIDMGRYNMFAEVKISVQASPCGCDDAFGFIILRITFFCCCLRCNV
ncbi:conserved hypothetical protein [Ricinus communis]|uniref:Uncharacterized protein n=1 Tax=Ricinus communis TaxID=3988 RepID=B9TA44_RICCO|nr:conserved hypothetical protein [Ricinus communis]